MVTARQACGGRLTFLLDMYALRVIDPFLGVRQPVRNPEHLSRYAR
ncbi:MULTISPECIES: hypothetical protein [unclassified Streptomyces]